MIVFFVIVFQLPAATDPAQNDTQMSTNLQDITVILVVGLENNMNNVIVNTIDVGGEYIIVCSLNDEIDIHLHKEVLLMQISLNKKLQNSLQSCCC